METNTSLSSSSSSSAAAATLTETMNEMCCENDATAAESACCALVGLVVPAGGGGGTSDENGGQQQQQQHQQRRSSSLSSSQLNSCQQHTERRRNNKKQEMRSRSRRLILPFSSPLFLLLLLAMTTTTTRRRQAGGFLLSVNAQPDDNENDLWTVYMPTPVPSNLSEASLIPTRAPTPKPAASQPHTGTVPSPRPALFPIFWAFEPTPQPVRGGGGGDGGDDPTALPTPEPAMVPRATFTPTPAPVWEPPVAKTLAPATEFPSSSPSEVVDEPVTASPSDEDDPPTSMPSSPPVLVPPTQSPTSQPTTPFPSSTPTTESPTTVTGYPTITPQPTPRPNRDPTSTPTSEPSRKARVPTTTPSLAPTLGIQSHDVDTVMKMTSMATKIISGIDWESATESHIKLSIQNNNRNLDPPLLDLEVKTDIKRQDFLPAENETGETESAQNVSRWLRRERRLQSELDPQPLQVKFVVRVRFRSEETLSFKNVSDLVGDAFNSEEERELYIERLQQTTNEGFPFLTTIDVLVEGSTPIEEPNEPDSSTGDGDDDEVDDGNVLDDSTLWIIIGAAGGGFLAIVALGFLACRRIGAREQQKRTENSIFDKNDMHNMNGHHGASALTASHNTSSAGGVKPFVSTEILVDRQDDVSTLGDPVFGNGMMGENGGGAERDEQTASVGNDYDYSKQYLRAQGISGSLMTDNSRDRLMSADSGRSSKLGQPVAPSVFSDDASFDQQFMMDHVVATEQRFDVTVPPGKLGMVVDTPNGGCPVVHAIKTESILANRVQVGDRLVAVDSEDVTAMTAVQVSKLISLRSDQDRKLVFVRFISPEAAMMMRTHSNYSNGGGHHVGGGGADYDDDDEEEEKEPNMMGP